jgi:hypothetical protein
MHFTIENGTALDVCRPFKGLLLPKDRHWWRRKVRRSRPPSFGFVDAGARDYRNRWDNGVGQPVISRAAWSRCVAAAGG